MIIKKHKKKPIFILGSLLVLAGIAAGVYVVYSNNGQSDPKGVNVINYNAPTNDQKAAGESIKENSVNPNDTSKPNVSGSDQPPSPAPQSSGKSKVDATLTHISSAQIGVSIDIVTNSGTCTLSLTSGSVTKTYTAGVQAQASDSACKGFNISGLTAGTWQITVHFENGSYMADTSGSLTI